MFGQAIMILVVGAQLQAASQITAEQVHQDATGSSTMCGITGRNANDLMEIVRRTSRLHKQSINSPRFELYSTDDSLTQWTFTQPSEPAYPAVSCRHTFQGADGGWRQTRDLRCDASRAACDRLFIEFRDLDERMKRALNGS